MKDQEGNNLTVVKLGNVAAILVPEGDVSNLTAFLRKQGHVVMEPTVAITTSSGGKPDTTTSEVIVNSPVNDLQEMLDGIDGQIPEDA